MTECTLNPDTCKKTAEECLFFRDCVLMEVVRSKLLDMEAYYGW
jgi:hypothetical protein